MKAFIISVALLALIVSASVINGIYISNVTNGLLKLEEAFPEKEDGESPSDPVISRAEELINKNYIYFCAFSNGKQASLLKNSFEQVKSIYLHGSKADYLSARANYREAIESFKTEESISFKGII